MSHKLSDAAIAQIVQLLQFGMLTGTDVTDQLRTLYLVVDSETSQLIPSPEFVEVFNENLSRLQEQADTLAEESND